ncbi:MAG: hypothetical protein FWC40_04555 [Proteobacteria bacterium]|nr:hypothetical protein [Pseudomonadota bacterium]
MKRVVLCCLCLGVAITLAMGCSAQNADPGKEDGLKAGEGASKPSVLAEAEPALPGKDVPLAPSSDDDGIIDGDGDNEAAQSAPETPESFSQPSIHAYTPLSPEQRGILASIRWDLPPEKLNAVKAENENKHFLWSDEEHPYMFEPAITGLGGTYIGIGTDQSYLYMGWQRPTLGFVVDYDPWVVMVHYAYFAFFDKCEDSACFREHFANRETGQAWLKEYYAQHPQQAFILSVHRASHRGITNRFAKIRRLDAKTFLSDPSIYAYLRDMVQSGRLVTLQANLLGDVAFSSIAQAMHQLGAHVTTLYLSNAEQYWNYSASFKQNIRALPYADNAIVMRTSATKPQNSDYRYSIQPVNVFKAWLDNPRGSNVKRVIRPVRITGPDHIPFTVDDFMPPEASSP